MWRCYKLVFQARSPVHIGYRRISNIQITRYYILGRTLWGAVTKKLAQFLGCRDYTNIAECVKDNLRFGYFFPARNPQEPLYPVYGDEGLKYGPEKRMASGEFERLFIRSIDLTAIDPFTTSAEEGMLHELEFISCKANGKPVFFIGNLFLKKGISLEGKKVGWKEGEIRISELVEEIFVGGERRYGFGNLALREEASKEVSQFLSGYSLEQDNFEPIIKVPPKNPFLAHCQTKEGDDFEGKVEPLVGREWENVGKRRGAGQQFSSPIICWMPGSWASEEKKLKVKPFGIWSD